MTNKMLNQPITLGGYKRRKLRLEIDQQAFERELLEDPEGDKALNGSPEKWFTVKEFAKRAGVPVNTVYQWVKRDKVRSDANSQGMIVVHPSDLVKVPHPTAFEEEDRVVWTGTFSESGREILKQYSLGSNESFTLEMGAQLLMLLVGTLPDEESKATVKEIFRYVNRHPHLMDTLKKNLDALSSATQIL